MGSKILSMQKINKSFNDIAVLKSVDFDIYDSELMALLGENGAGKSTLMKILSGVYKKDGGKIKFLNKEVEFNNTRHWHLI